MRKKKTAPPKQNVRILRAKRTYILIATACAIVLLACGMLAAPWSNSLGSRKLRYLASTPPAQLPSPANPSKEYIYAGGRLIATEEPNVLLPPTLVEATTVSSVQITLFWTASANADHYVVERSSQLGSFMTLNGNVTGTSYSDNTVAINNAYLYRVRAADAVGNVSSESNSDVATAISFEDDPFPASPILTVVRAQHILQLREAINAVRRLIPSLGNYGWTQSSTTLVGAPLRAVDVEELRTALDEALVVLQLPTGGYTNSSLSGELIQKVHITELRNGVK